MEKMEEEWNYIKKAIENNEIDHVVEICNEMSGTEKSIYGVTGELTYGFAVYENEYTHNGESYNPNIHSPYLRAKYYNVVTASIYP